MNDYPIDVYYSIFKYIRHSDFPIIGCWKLSNNSKKAIIKLGYNKCPRLIHNTQSKINKQRKMEYKNLVDCNICHANFGFTCCDLNYWSLLQCYNCLEIICEERCGSHCGNCHKACCEICLTVICSVCLTNLCNQCSEGHDHLN